jgi:FtsZ-interacting cell division protein ZipA
MSQLRWSLLILGVLFVAALAWWEWRRPRQASGGLERTSPREGSGATHEALPRLAREPLLTLPELRAREPAVPRSLPVLEMPAEQDEETVPAPAPAGPRERGEPELGDMDAVAAAPPTVIAADPEPAPGPWVAARESLPELPAAPPPLVQWPPEPQRRILALRLIAPPAERFAGRSLRQALAAEGFVLGEFSIFHKPDEERRAVLSAASLTRPGTFEVDTMDSQHYGGLSLFAVLPGPKPPGQAFDDLVFTARNLNERLHGVLQDQEGGPLTPARIAVLREQLRGGAAS